MNQITTTQKQAVLNLYHLYMNTFDNTPVIITDTLSSLFERTLTNMGSSPKLIASSYILSDLQVKSVELGMEADVIDNLSMF